MILADSVKGISHGLRYYIKCLLAVPSFFSLARSRPVGFMSDLFIMEQTSAELYSRCIERLYLIFSVQKKLCLRIFLLYLKVIPAVQILFIHIYESDVKLTISLKIDFIIIFRAILPKFCSVLEWFDYLRLAFQQQPNVPVSFMLLLMNPCRNFHIGK